MTRPILRSRVSQPPLDSRHSGPSRRPYAPWHSSVRAVALGSTPLPLGRRVVLENVEIPQVTQKDTVCRVSPFGLKMRGKNLASGARHPRTSEKQIDGETCRPR